MDQQPPADRRPRKKSKVERRSTEASTSSSSSPTLAGGHAVEQVDQFNHYMPTNLPDQDYPGSTAPLSVSTLSSGSRGTPPLLDAIARRSYTTHTHTAPINLGGFEFPPQNDRPQHLDSPFFDHSPMSAGPGHPPLEDPSSGYWESPMTPAFSPRFSGPPQLPVQYHRDIGGAFASFGDPRQDSGWPQRSASFGQVEDLQHSYQHLYQHPSHIEYPRRMTYMPPSSLQNSGKSSNTSMIEAPSAPVSASIGSQPLNHLGFHSWTALPGPAILGHAPMNKTPEYVGWNSETGQLAKVHEEDAGPQFSGDPPVMYSSAGHH